MELTVPHTPMKGSGRHVVAALCAVAISLGMQASAGHSQDLPASAPVTAAINPKPAVNSRPAKRIVASVAMEPPLEGYPVPKGKGQYYVDFRARTAASYGHAFVWYGRTDERAVEVAGLHPATESVVPYIIGHVLPVPAETGKSYGDLDEQYVTAHYRVYLREPDAKRVFAYIKHLQEVSGLWHAGIYNCTAFIGAIASYMGLKTPAISLMYPEDYVNKLRELNGGRKVAHLTPEN